MEATEYISVIQWLGQHNQYYEMLRYARQASESYPTNEDLRILLSLSLFLTNQTREATKEISELSDRSKNILPALIVQSLLNKSVSDLETKIKEYRLKAQPSALGLASTLYLILNKPTLAKEYADKAYKSDPLSHSICIVKGWCELESNSEGRPTTDYFSIVLKEDGKSFGALLGAAKVQEQIREHEEVIAILNKLIVRYPQLSVPLVEKLANQLALKDWDQVIETTQRILNLESYNIEALKANTLVALCRDGNFSKGAQCLKQLFKTMNQREPKNVTLLVSCTSLFSKLSNSNEMVISELFRATEKMLQQQGKSSDPELLIEHANLCLKMGNLKEAETWYRSTVMMDESSFPALIGLAQCQLMDTSPGAGEVALQQVELLLEIQQSNSKTAPELYTMSANLFQKKDSVKAFGFLEKAARIIREACSKLAYGYRYLDQLNPDLCSKIVQEYLVHLPSQLSNDPGKDNSCLSILEMLAEACPGFSDTLLVLAKVRMQLGDHEGAKDSLRKLLEDDPTNASGYLLMAQILARQGNHHQAAQTLESGVSCNFKVRDDPMYHAITGAIVRERGDYESSLEHYINAIAGIKKMNEFSVSDRTTVYLELIEVYSKLKRFEDAVGLMEEAKVELASSSEEGRIVISNAELALEMGDVDKAIFYLNQVTPDANYFLQARIKLAEIYLNHRKDRTKFAQCYRELVERCPGSKTYEMLGDAYIAIQEPEKAIEAYELSIKTGSRDKISARKMGKALIKTHQYQEAIRYYKEAMKNEENDELKLDLAELYMKMKQYNNAETILVKNIKGNVDVSDPTKIDLYTKQLHMLAKVREKCGNINEALGTMKEAIDLLARHYNRVNTFLAGLEKKQLIAQFCLEAADYASTLRDFDQAASYYREALNYTPTDVTTLLSLAKLYMQTSDLEKCAQTCSTILTTDPSNEAASVMMADLAFRRVDFETAAYHFRQILLQRPTYWTALARLIEVSRRMNSMEELEEWLNRAKDNVNRSKDEAGYHYCAGLYDWRQGKMNSALRHFNMARRDPEWGQQAIYNMVEICLDPDDDSTLSTEVFSDDEAEYQDTRTIALKTIQRLLQELNPKGNPHEILTRRLLGNFFLLATKQKSNIEKALQDCTVLASQESLKDHVGPALGLAMAHILLKQTPRARNHLKRVSKNAWTFEDAEYLERIWILLANIYIQNSKYEIASELLKKCLQYNATCIKAHELIAQIAEKEQNYTDAIAHYNKAWKFGGKAKLSIGYKLAHCCLKHKLYADAIDTSYEILRQNPNYPRVRKEILEKSINYLRT